MQILRQTKWKSVSRLWGWMPHISYSTLLSLTLLLHSIKITTGEYLRASKCTEFLGRRLRPGPLWGSLQRSPNPVAGFRGRAHEKGTGKGVGKEGQRGGEDSGEWE